MSDAPVIGIACELEKHPEHAVKDKSALNLGYSDAILRAGGVPLLIPVSEGCEHLAGLFALLDGVMLPGSEDIPSSVYGQEPHPTLKPMPLAEYETWAALLRLAFDESKPVFGICGGLQVLNVMLGGTLTQDIPSQTGSKTSHRNENRPPDPVHDINVEPDSRLAGILGSTHLRVNSAHHQAVDRVADGLRVTARCSADGVIEAAEVPGHPFLVTVQWHPERFFEGDSSDRLFNAFVTACREHR